MKNITKENFKFLKDLEQNNNKVWFEENKPRYTTFQQEMISFADTVLKDLEKHDHLETPSGKKSLYRIYRDVRFSKDKTPYKNHWGCIYSRATKALRGSYYVHIQPGQCFVGGGFWGPNSADLKRIRAEFDVNADEFRKIITHKNFVDTFGTLQGNKVKTAPRGYPKDHPNLDLLRYKQFLVMKKFTNKEALSADFSDKVADAFNNIRPFFDFMSSVLTTNLNGESIL